jgi:hypothetical protein
VPGGEISRPFRKISACPIAFISSSLRPAR